MGFIAVYVSAIDRDGHEFGPESARFKSAQGSR